MPQKLLIVESPSKAKTIGKYLGSEYVVKASVGHVRDLPKSSKNAIDIAGGFIPHYEIVKKKAEIVEEIAQAAKKASEIILATDPDREGEAIAWHIAEILKEKLGKTHPKILRAVYHEITKEAVEEALTHPREIDQNLRRAQEARRVLDRLVGYDLSGLIWKKIRYGLSAGRVQSPALRILAEREREIQAFKPETFWVITAQTQTPKKANLILTCVEEPRDKKEVERILSVGTSGAWSVTEVSETKAKRAPRPPFITSTLQQAASTRLGFSPGRTMGVAQKLYEAGLITYMRTDSTNLSTSAKGQIAAVIEKKFGKEYVALRVFAGKVKNAQEAHEAIRPTTLSRESAGSTPDQKKLYQLIWERTIASQMPDAEMLRTKVTANLKSTDEAKPYGEFPNFAANGVRLLSPGWLRADPMAKGEEVELPFVLKGDALDLRELTSKEKETEPPTRYSEAGLIKELEKRGIGRPSTYASIMETLQEREYVTKENRSLKPTDTGMVVSGFLEEHFPSYISDTFTADMEDQLDEVAEGKREYEKTLRDFYTPFKKEVKSKEKLDKATTLGTVPPEFVCPVCKGPLVWKLGRGGTFMSCARFPDCIGALSADGKEIKPDEPIGTDPATGLPIFLLNGRFGYYLQVGTLEKGSKEKPRRASVPRTFDITKLTIADALKFLSLPRVLGTHPATGKTISANMGRFGPYVVHESDFRSLKPPDDLYTIELPRALEIFAQEKKTRFKFKKKA